MTAQELNTYINRVLGNSIRCLLPSYWWKRLLTQIVEYVDGIDTKFDNKVKTLNNKINNIDLDDYTTKSEFNSLNSKVNSLDGDVSDLEIEKQDVLISGTSIKTINGVSILGSGDIEIKSESGGITSETDPIFTASAAANITTADITNWNNKTSNSGTITEITMNGVSKGTSGVVDLGNVITEHQDISGKLDKTEASNTYVTKQELIQNIDPYNTDGIYAVTQDGDLVSYDRANESCIGVALVKGDHKFMIAKNDAQQHSTYVWMSTCSDLELTNYTTVDGVNESGAFFDQSKTQLSTDYKTWTAGALSDFNGKENSTIIASVASRTHEMGSALKAFNSSSTTDNNYGLDDWYIPALGQLALIRIHQDEINEFFVKIGGSVFGSSYWSSSEESLGLAWQISFNSSSTVGSPNKDMHSKCVRFIRDITIEPLSKTSQLINDSNYIVDYSMFPDGVYAVTNTLNLVSRENADESCIGVAFIQGEHRYMISKYDSEESYWGYNLNIDIPGITNYDTTEEAEQDFNGYNNTKAIQNAYITYDKTINEKDMCYFLNAFNVKSESQLFDDWYIPAYGQWHLMLPFQTEINAVFNKINGDFLARQYQTSTERNASTSHTYSEFNGGWSSPGKQYLRYVRFIRDLKSIREELDQQTLSISTLQDSVTILQDNQYKPLITLNSNKAHLLPNKYYRVNTQGYSSLTITLEPETDITKLNEYLVEFNTSSSGTTISLPDTIKWANGEIPSFVPDMTYQISIVNNLGIATGFK